MEPKLAMPGMWQKGYSQASGTDYNKTFTPTAGAKSVCSLIQMAAQYDLEL